MLAVALTLLCTPFDDGRPGHRACDIYRAAGPRASPPTGLPVPTRPGATASNVRSVTGFEAGQTISIDGETRTIASVGTVAAPMTTVFAPVSMGPLVRVMPRVPNTIVSWLWPAVEQHSVRSVTLSGQDGDPAVSPAGDLVAYTSDQGPRLLHPGGWDEAGHPRARRRSAWRVTFE